jgi:CRP-like cAMP-binding protein
MVSLLSDGAAIEVAAGGRLGLLGVSVIMDEESEATEMRVVIAGSALRILAPVLRATMEFNPALRTNLARMVPMLMARMSWMNACSARHSVEQRVARWLLCASADLGSPALAVTQEVVAAMLGVRRAGISEIFSRWSDAGLITTHRSHIAIEDLPRLETRACECYREDQRALGRRSAEFAAPTPERAAAIHGLIRRYAALSGKTLVTPVH